MIQTKRVCLAAAAALLLSGLAFAQPSMANLRGTVTDPSGAVVQGAAVTLTSPSGAVKALETDTNGAWAATGLMPGAYTVRIGKPGFSLYERMGLDLPAAKSVVLDVKLAVASEKQEVTVTDSVQVELDPAKNASALVLSGQDLDMLSDDPDDLQNDLLALAGPAAGPNGGQIFVDGFSNGQLPPKDSIREIRINSNPFSAEFDKIGFGRIEILTKPGTDRLRGSLFYQTDTSDFDARNPFADTKPSFLTRQIQGTISGSINKKTSFFLDVSDRHQDDQALIRATLLDSNYLPSPFISNVGTPTERISFSPRVDYQLSSKHTLQARYTWTDVHTDNAGVGQFNLLAMGVNTKQLVQSAQATDTWVVNATTINETRFQYTRSTYDELGVSGTPTINVAGAFSGGSANLSAYDDTQNAYELQNYTTMTRGPHQIKFGARIRGTLETNLSNANFNGSYRFAALTTDQCGTTAAALSTCHAYLPTVLGLQQGLSMAQIIANGGGAYQYSLTAGNPLVGVGQMDIAPFIQDDWRVKPSLTLSLGLRYETQTDISDKGNFAPRVGLAWGIGGGQGRLRQPKTVIRSGFGIFYDRFALAQVLSAERLNGVNLQQYVVENPQFACALNNVCSGSVPPVSQLTTQPVATYQIDPNLVAPRIMQSAIGFDRQLPKNTTLSVNYTNSRGTHELLTRQINAPCTPAGVQDPIAPSVPVCPFQTATIIGSPNPVYQFESGGLFKQNQLTVNMNARMNPKYALFGYYSYGHASSNTDGVNNFPANTYDLSTEWSRAGFDIRHRFLMGGNIMAPLGIRFNPMILYNSAPPFNIVIGQDLNGDTITNDRPSFASPLSNPLYVIQTPWGAFNTRPVAGETIIPRNYGQGFGSLTINMRVSRTWGFGEPVTRTQNNNGNRGGGGPLGGFGPPRGGPPPGGPGGGPQFFGGGTTNSRYQLTLSVELRNLLNTVNPSAPVGVLSSPLFGEPQGIVGGFGGNTTQSANRRLEMQLRFSF